MTDFDTLLEAMLTKKPKPVKASEKTKRLGSIEPMGIEHFKHWLKELDTASPIKAEKVIVSAIRSPAVRRSVQSSDSSPDAG